MRYLPVTFGRGRLSQPMKPSPLKLGLKPERMLSALRDSGKTRLQIAEEVGVNKATVGRWIACKREPETLEMLGKLCRALGKNLAYLTGDEEAAQSPEEVMMLRLSRTADPTLLQAALAVLAAGQTPPKTPET